MYEKFYRFREKPFQIVPNAEYLYRSYKHDKALTFLEYGLSENLGCILLTGEIGSGKTILIQYILTHLDDDTDVAVIFNTNVTADQLLDMILNEFELPHQKSKAEALDALNHLFVQRYAENRNVLLIIDEGQNLSEDALEEIRMLSNLQSDDQMLLQVMLVGQPELKAKLHDPSMRQFAQRIQVNYHLTGLNLEETGNYISHRLQKADGDPKLFTPSAVEYIYKLSGGIPRSINMVCQAALVYGFADEARMISQDIIRQLIDDDIGIGLDVALKKSDSEPAPPSSNGFHERLDSIENGIRNLTEVVSARVEEREPAPPSTNGFHERLDSIENGIRNLTEIVSTRVGELEADVQNSNEELLGRLSGMLKNERKRNQELLKSLSTLELKYMASRRISEKFKAEIIKLRKSYIHT